MKSKLYASIAGCVVAAFFIAACHNPFFDKSKENPSGGQNPSAEKFAVSFAVDGAGGTLTAAIKGGAAITSGAEIEKGKTVVFTAAPASGQEVAGWTLNGAAVNGVNATYELVVSAVSDVKVKFQAMGTPLEKFAVTFAVDGAGGTLTAAIKGGAAITSGAEIEKGKTVVFTAAPDSGYEVESWTDTSLGNNPITFYNSSTTYEIYVKKISTVKVKFRLTVNPPPGGFRMILTTSKAIGEQFQLEVSRVSGDVWVDLNNNGVKDAPKENIIPGSPWLYNVESQTFTVYGKVGTFLCFSAGLTALDVSNNPALEYLNCSSNNLTTLDLSKNTELTGLSCMINQLTTLDFSKNTKLKSADCHYNNINGAGMTALVTSLPAALSAPRNFICVIADVTYPSIVERNVCTVADVAIATGKGWRIINSSGFDYPGS